MFRPLKIPVFGLVACATLILTASAQIGGTGWTPKTLNFKIQSPTNAPENQRYWFTNNIYHCLTYSNDGAFSVGNTTLPRTEQRYNSDYTNGEIQYQSMIMAPGNENSYCVFQIHTGDAQSPTFGSTTFMAFWFTSSGGSVHDYSGTTLATNLANKWFQLNVDHNVVTGTIRVWINQKLVWTQQDNGAGDFYMKDGVYEQSHSPTLQMDTYLTNILMWTSSGTNPPAGPTGLTATATNAQIRLAWNDSVGATSYHLKRSTNNTGPFTNIIANITSTNYTDGTVAVGPTYYYVVSALDSFGQSTNSSPANAIINPGYQLSAAPSSQSVVVNESTNYTVTISTNSHFSGTIFLKVSGLPAGASAVLSPASFSQAGNAMLTILAAPNAVTGTYPLTIIGTNGAFTVATNITLTILPPQPLLASPVLQGGNFVLRGSGGTPGKQYYVLSSTNPALPLSQWTSVGTDVFDANGDFNFTNTPGLAMPQLYFLLQTP
jgi:hypothetical protein